MKLFPPLPNSTRYMGQCVEDGAILATLREVVATVVPPEDPAELVVEWLAVGGQAKVFLVRRHDEGVLWRGHRELVVKLYDRSKPQVPASLADAWDGLSRLRGALVGCRINGWRIESPAPVYQSPAPAALVMTRVPGKSLGSLVRGSGPCDLSLLDELGQTAVAALQRFWVAESRMYGDLNLHNILYDLPSRTLSFVDCGLPESTWRCEGAPRNFHPVSRDLAYLLFSTAAAVRALLAKPRARQRERWLIGEMLSDAANLAVPSRQRQDLLNEIHACAHVHLSRIRTSPLPGGLWRRYVKQSASRCVDEVLEGVSRGTSGGSAQKGDLRVSEEVPA